MNKKGVVKRKDLLLRERYESGEISADEFLQMLFSSNEGDRRRRRIVEKTTKTNKQLQRA